VGNVGHFAKAHQLNGNVLILFRHGTSNCGIGRGEDTAHAIMEAKAISTVSDAAPMAATL